LEWKLDFEAGKPQEVAVVGAKRRAVFDGERREVSIHDQWPPRSRFWQQVAQDGPVAVCGIGNHNVVLGKPDLDGRYGLVEIEGPRKQLWCGRQAKEAENCLPRERDSLGAREHLFEPGGSTLMCSRAAVLCA
jgi:hypothetical protein